MRRLLASLALLAFAASCEVGASDSRVRIVPSFDSEESLARWEFTEEGAWSAVESDGGGSLELASADGGFAYQPPHRSPHRIALLRGVEVGDFDLFFEAMSTGRSYGHRDLCVFFAWQTPDRFHYLHLAPVPDANSHNLFLVDGAPRRSLEPVFEEGLEWPDDTWVQIEVRRRGGVVTVHADGREVLRSDQVILGRGRIGIGSFDDSGRWRRLVLQAAASDISPASD